ncbi:DUF6417 family protein [Streptomyces filipinensis]
MLMSESCCPGERLVELRRSEMDALRRCAHLGERLHVPPAEGLADRVRTARRLGSLWVLYLNEEQITSVAYALHLRSMSGSATDANRFARRYGVAGRRGQLQGVPPALADAAGVPEHGVRVAEVDVVFLPAVRQPVGDVVEAAQERRQLLRAPAQRVHSRVPGVFATFQACSTSSSSAPCGASSQSGACRTPQVGPRPSRRGQQGYTG